MFLLGCNPQPDYIFTSGRRKKRFSEYFIVWRPISAVLCVRGIPLGQSFTQFWALPQSAMRAVAVSDDVL